MGSKGRKKRDGSLGIGSLIGTPAISPGAPSARPLPNPPAAEGAARTGGYGPSPTDPGRERRRPRKPRTFDTSVPSPCISVCQVDPASRRCIGCLRTTDEIREWPIMTADQKRATLARIAARKAGG